VVLPLSGATAFGQRDYTGSGKPKPKPNTNPPTTPKPKPNTGKPKPRPRPDGGNPRPAQQINCKNEPKTIPVTFEVPVEPFTFETALIDEKGTVTREPGQARVYREKLDGDQVLEMVEVPGGIFCLGTPDEEDSEGNESPRLNARVPGFFMGKYEVTQAQWKFVSGLPKVKIDLPENPSNFKDPQLPVDSVTWEEAVEFCARLSRKTGRIYRLPSETEWEYASLGGRTGPFGFGLALSSTVENYDSNLPLAEEPPVPPRKKPLPVGSLIPNPYGLFDMQGNVREWCLDEYCKRFTSLHAAGAPTRNLRRPEDRLQHVIRGGSWATSAYGSRSQSRDHDLQTGKNQVLGFRVVLSDKAYGAEEPVEQVDDGNDGGEK
jgi:formylglycine-generating enzyme required for sulfatase activity